MLGITELAFVCLIILVTIYYATTPRKNYPPGPRALPLIGNIHQFFGAHIHIRMAELARYHGDIYSLHFPGQPLVIVISSAALAREALMAKKDVFSGRPSLYSMDVFSKGGKDVGFSDFDAVYILKKKIGASALRKSMNNVPGVVRNELEYLEKRLLSSQETLRYDCREEIGLTTLNIVSSLLVGHRYERHDPEFLKMYRMTENFGRIATTINILDVFPCLYYFPLEASKMLRETVALRDDVIYKIYHRHMSEFKEHRNGDITECLIQGKINAAEEHPGVAELITEDHVAMVILDVISGAQHTTSTTVSWFLLYMMQYPEVQARAQKEIDEIIGSDRWPEVKDRERLSYVNSVIAETLRFSSLTPLGAAPHKATRDTTLRGYGIPKDTILIFNHWAIHRDPEQWKEPGKFDPTRFLEDGKFIAAGVKSYLPFNAGRRHCMGEVLAKALLFLIVTRLLQRFIFVADRGAPLPDLEGSGGFINQPKDFKFCASPRTIDQYTPM